ncbi:Tad domain-containing protein [Arthrobacter sp. GMC3]|uniref:Tad domain-containing protein n=1 Tax=Arthrobacter sp. GMC3 TaxID=2058894 RepID=UPI000CE45E37|nr:Tad domain-containing protein [Arthrobacter sp. GMC3]
MYSLKKRQPRSKAAQGTAAKRSKEFRERGATSILLVLLIPVLFGALAVALDFGKLSYERQQLSNAMDASALAASQDLPDPVSAKAAALKFAKSNGTKTPPDVTFWCVVASTGAAKTPVAGQIPAICNPGATSKAQCNETICAFPCLDKSPNKCNTITVTANKDVPFAFAPVIGIKTGNTGAQSSSACRGSCGALSPNPMDIAIVADRTGSMGDNLPKLVSGIQNTLQTMTKAQQYVALGTIGRSVDSPKNGTCVTTASTSETAGPWIPIPYSDNYTGTPAFPGATPPLNPASTLVQGVGCLKASGTGTYLASPLKAAARYVLDDNNLKGMQERSSKARKAIIFETDGEPNEVNFSIPKGIDPTKLDNSVDLGNKDLATACSKFIDVAKNAKAANILVVTVAFGGATSAKCGTRNVRDVLAEAASDDPKGGPSKANTCAGADIAAENSDGDYFFCAADGAELGPIFISAINSISPNSHLIRIPD